jgi:hypothetical protein
MLHSSGQTRHLAKLSSRRAALPCHSRNIVCRIPVQHSRAATTERWFEGRELDHAANLACPNSNTITTAGKLENRIGPRAIACRFQSFRTRVTVCPGALKADVGVIGCLDIVSRRPDRSATGFGFSSFRSIFFGIIRPISARPRGFRYDRPRRRACPSGFG